MIRMPLPGLRPDCTLKTQPWMEAPWARAIVAALEAKGVRVRFVGGCVRDALVGRPAKDVDIATPDPPDRVIELLHAAGLKAAPTGIKHGTVTAIADGHPIEVTTLRHDVESHGRHATVAFTDDWVADAARRDFTMNAISADANGQVFDPFGGIADLAEGRVRFVRDAETRIIEDVLRLLRFFRFAAWYGRGPLDPDGLAACKKLAERLPGLSAERVRAELLRLLEAPNPVPVLRTMIAEGILAPILPELRDLDRLAALIALEPEPDGILRLAALLPPGSDLGAVVAARLKLSNAESRRLDAATRPRLAASPLILSRDRREWRRALQTIGAETMRDLARLTLAEEALFGPIEESDAAAFAEFLETARDWTPQKLPIAGRDAVALGVEKGPRVGQLIDAVARWWEAGDYRATREECLAKLKELANREPD
jgi:poly(A) polymerase